MIEKEILAALNSVCDGNSEFYNNILALTVAEEQPFAPSQGQQDHAEACPSAAFTKPVLAAIPKDMNGTTKASQPRPFIGQTKTGFAGKLQAMMDRANKTDNESDDEEEWFTNPLPSESSLAPPTLPSTSQLAWDTLFLKIKKDTKEAPIGKRAKVFQKKVKNSETKTKGVSKKERVKREKKMEVLRGINRRSAQIPCYRQQ